MTNGAGHSQVIPVDDVRVSLHRRADLPIILAPGILAETPAISWWNGARLVFSNSDL